MLSVLGAIQHIRENSNRLVEAASKGLLTHFPSLLSPTRNICDILARIDIDHLHGSPIRTLNEFSNALSEVLTLINDVISKSFPAEQGVKDGVVRPLALVQNQTNINSWRGGLENLNATLFQLAGPMIAQQEIRRAWVGAPPIQMELTTSPVDAKSDVMWRYMPLRNLLRCESASGIWMSSLERLRTWSRPGIPDIREGDIPPAVEQLKERLMAAAKTGKEAWAKVCKEYGINAEDASELSSTFESRVSLETTFVSSWARRKGESNTMWSAYGDAASGVAIRSDVSKLQNCEWRAPLELCGYLGSNRVRGLTLRGVRYFDFEATDELPSDIRDLYLPLMKRTLFDDEHETRLLAFTNHGVASMGFTLHCNLTEIISEIVVGPHADFDDTVEQIRAFAPDLRRIQVSRSKMTPE